MNNLRIWNPWNPADPFNKMFEDMPRSLPMSGGETMNIASLNLWEDETNYVAELPVPGLSPDDISISLDDRYLTISGELNEEHDDEHKKYHVREISSLSFSRTVMLPGNIDADNIDAKCEHGILKVTMPKKLKSSSRKIAVK